MGRKDIVNNSKKFGFTRREFIKSSLVLTAGISLIGCRDMLVSPDEVSSSDIQIIVIGAGLSGLATAYELKKAGYNVIVLEADNRAGGRVLTLRQPFLDGQFAEAGAARIPPNHDLTHHYINEFELQLDYFYPRTGDFVKYYNGSKTIIPNEEYLSERPWSGSPVHADYTKINGGTDKLPQSFADYLSGKILYNTPVTMIDQISERVKVKVATGQEYTADRVVVTVPLPVLNKIEFKPQLSTRKMDAANGDYNYASSTRVYLQTKTRFWQNENLSGWGRTDWPEEMWQPTFDQNGTGGILMSYASNTRADELDLMSNDERVGSLLNRWKDFFPELKSNFNGGTSFSWVHQEWAQGAYAHPTVGQMEEYDSILGTPEGKIHFAGEHISKHHGWMQGALESAQRVVDEIITEEVVA